MKKFLITVAIVVFFALLITMIVLLIGNSSKDKPKEEKEMITIKFDTNGGEEVDNIKIEKGKTISLPETSKDGYELVGWYLNDEKVTEETTFDKDVTLVAEWEKEVDISKNPKSFMISFDTNGGSRVSSISVECDKTLPKLPTPTKEGYNFISWADKHGKVIGEGALLTCEHLTLYANWEKKENVKEPTEPQKKYTCPSGYTLDSTKCIMETTANEKCPDGTKVISGGICATVTNAARKDYSKSCEKAHVTYNSFAGYVEGKVVDWGIKGCAYYKTSDANKSECESHGFKWVTPESACYVKWDTSTIINTCNHLTGYVDIPNPNTYVTNAGLNAGCFPTSEKEKYCDSDYTLSNGKCIKTIDATVE